MRNIFGVAESNLHLNHFVDDRTLEDEKCHEFHFRYLGTCTVVLYVAIFKFLCNLSSRFSQMITMIFIIPFTAYE